MIQSNKSLEEILSRLTKEVTVDIRNVGHKVGNFIADLVYLEFIPSQLKKSALRNNKNYTDFVSSFRIVPKTYVMATAMTLGYKGYSPCYFIGVYLFIDLMYLAIAPHKTRSPPANAIIDYGHSLYKRIKNKKR